MGPTLNTLGVPILNCIRFLGPRIINLISYVQLWKKTLIYTFFICRCSQFCKMTPECLYWTWYKSNTYVCLSFYKRNSLRMTLLVNKPFCLSVSLFVTIIICDLIDSKSVVAWFDDGSYCQNMSHFFLSLFHNRNKRTL